MQYIGQTINSLNTRCIQHRSGIKSGNEPTFVRHHFTKVHDPSNLRITPLCTVSTSDYDPNTKRNSLIINQVSERSGRQNDPKTQYIVPLRLE